jgi:hypothetical protein
MIREFNFSFDELVIDHKLMAGVMGYENGNIPPPFDEYMEMALKEASLLDDIRAAYLLFEDAGIDKDRKVLSAGGKEFKIGHALCSELNRASRFAFFVCTAGKTISEKSVSLLRGDDPILGYVYDILGSAITESAGDKMQFFLKKEAEKTMEKITNRYSPGYCQWSVEEQHKLFSLFGGSSCGVSLTRSALMQPVKSISGVIGIGRNVEYREYQCTLCSSENCVYRRIRGL